MHTPRVWAITEAECGSHGMWHGQFFMGWVILYANWRSHRDWARPAFEYLSVSGRGTAQQWPATGAGALSEADLGVA